jgi:hypothetical protein
MYDPEEDNESSNTGTHLQDHIGEHEDMELDDLDQPEELTSSTTFTEEQSTPVPPASSLYNNNDETETNIPTATNPVSSSFLIPSFSKLFSSGTK